MISVALSHCCYCSESGWKTFLGGKRMAADFTALTLLDSETSTDFDASYAQDAPFKPKINAATDAVNAVDSKFWLRTAYSNSLKSKGLSKRRFVPQYSCLKR